jgi:pimeloyl-ACP methyl ester carboxylesterase
MAEVNGARLYYEIMGRGHPLVLIGGGGCMDRRMWNDQVVPFAERYQLVRYDPRGIGRSTMPSEPFSHDEDLYELLRFLEVDKAYLLGLSFGGGVAVDFGVEHPEMVDALIPAASGLSSLKDETMKGLSVLSELVKEKGVAQVVQMILDSPAYPVPGNVSARFKIKEILLENAHVFRSDFSFVRLMRPVHPPVDRRLSEIDAPSLILVGERDYNEIHAIADQLESGIRGARKVVMTGAGHMLNLEKPEEFNRIVLEFLSKL